MVNATITEPSSFETECQVADSPSCVAYVDSKLTTLKQEALTRKKNTFDGAMSRVSNSLDADYNAAMYGVRQMDVNNVQSAIRGMNEEVKNANVYNKDTSRRQYEINEWYYYNKLETLFFLQVFLISTLTMTILIYMYKRGYMTAQSTGLAVAALCAVVVVVGISRYYYTNRTRDRRLWHRRYFGTMAADKPDLISCPTPLAPSPSGITINLNSIFSEKTTECTAALKPAYNQWFDTVSAEIRDYQLAGSPTSSIFGNTSISLPDKCK
jgi:hypothetical protein